jgi:acyl-CoA synthetase (NDP forming)
MAGSDAAMDAFFRDCGIVRVDMLETLLEIAPLLAGRRPPQLSRAPRVAVLTTTGGGAASVVDRLGLHGIETVAPGSHAPIIDLTMAATPQKYAEVLDALLDSPACDGVLAVAGSSAQFHPQLAVEPILGARRTVKPLAAFFTPHAEGSLKLLAQAGIAAFRTPEACADAFAAYFAWRAPRHAPQLPPVVLSRDLCASLGIAVPQSQVAHAPDFSHTVPYPVAVKIYAPGVEHKTEVGGVILGVRDQAEFMEKARTLRSAQVLVQKMESGLAEAIVGYRDDPLVGPLVLVGAGGILAEVYKDFVLRLAPVSVEEAEEMIGQVKGLAVIRGFRNLPRGDVRALAQAVSAMSRLALVPGRPVAEAECNPVIVKPSGAVAVDSLIVMKE